MLELTSFFGHGGLGLFQGSLDFEDAEDDNDVIDGDDPHDVGSDSDDANGALKVFRILLFRSFKILPFSQH